MKKKNLLGGKEEVDQQFQEDSFLIKVNQKKPNGQKPPSKWQTIFVHGKKHSILYFLLLTTIFVALLIIKFQSIYQFEARERDSLQPQINKIVPDTNSKQNLFKKVNQVSLQSKKNQNSPPLSSLNNKKNQPAPKPNGKNKLPLKKIKKNEILQPEWPLAGLTKQQYTFALRRLAIKDQKPKESSLLVDEQRRYFQQKYNLSKYTEELPICVVVPSYNNTQNDRHIKNMKSIIMQEYKNYHIVFIDDGSPDQLGKQVQIFLKNQTVVPPQRYTVVINQEQRLSMYNQRRAANEFCQPEEIMMVVDGDDELLGRQVFRLFNAIFQQKKVWFMYTNYLPNGGYVGYSRPIPDPIIKYHQIRQYQFSTSHLKAYYTQLFRNIKEEDLKDSEGRYLRTANVIAITFPILEMAEERIVYIPEYVYYYNGNTGHNNRSIRKEEQQKNLQMLRMKKSYKRIDTIMSPIQ